MTSTVDTYETDFDGLKRLGKEFLAALPTANIDEADAGLKCFQLAYLNGKFTEAEQYQAAILLQIISMKFLRREEELVGDNY